MKIAILTRLPSYYSERRLQEEAENRGHEVKMIRYSDCHINLTGELAGVGYKGEELHELDVIIPRVAPPMVSYGAAIVRQLEVEGTYSISGSISLVRAWDKLRALQVLSKAKVTIPRTIFSRNADDIDTVLETLRIPLIVRSLSDTSNNGSVLAETQRAARSVIKAFSVNNKAFLIQEYIQSEGGVIRALVVGSAVIASVKLPGILDDNELALPMPLDDGQKRSVLRAAKSLGLSLCTVDVAQNNEGPIIIDIQPVPGLELLEKTTHRNLAGKIIEYIEMNAKRRNKKDKIGA